MAKANLLTFTNYRKKSVWIKVLVLFSFLLVFISGLLLGKEAEAAIMSMTPQYKELNFGETFITDLRLNSEKQVINAVQATITYPSDMLEVKDVSRGGSFFTLWPKEPTVDHSAGTISFVGGIPHGSFVVDGKILSITFRPKSSGGVEIDFDQENTSVHLNDGQGTKADLKLISGVYQITSAVLATISSPTHPKEDVWYQNNSPIFRWETSTGAEYSYTLSADSEAIPPNRPVEVSGEALYTDLSDGIYYFVLNVRLPEKDWTLAGKRRVMIDQTSPLPFELMVGTDSVIYEGKYFLSFLTTDLTSGIDYYNVIEGGNEYKKVQSPYLLKDQSLEKRVVVRAFDKAGNLTEAARGAPSEKTREGSDNTMLLIVIVIVFLVMTLIFLLIIFCRKEKFTK